MTIKLRISALAACGVALACAVGCGDDDDTPPDESGGRAGEDGGRSGAASGGRSGATNGGRNNAGRSGAGTSGAPQGGGAGGEGGEPPTPPACNVYDPEREIEDVPTDNDGVLDAGGETTFTLTSDRTWRLNGRTFVPDGVTLRIEPCTLIVGTPRPMGGSLFITRGARIEADGSADAPIVFTSEDYQFRPNAPWGGVVLLGNAPIGASSVDAASTPERIFEGLTDENATYGGDDPEDSSGSMSYVRIEYGGDVIVADKEINGLTLAGVGSGTDLHHIMVKRTMDDCFEWFGGTVDAHHLICENPGDDMFDTDEMFRGHLQFLFGRVAQPGTSADPNGFEWDGNQPNQAVAERGMPRAANATLCGLGARGAAVGFGAMLRRGLMPGTSLINTIITGFDNGLDTRDAIAAAGTQDANVSWTNSLFFENFTNNFAFAMEIDAGNPANNDAGFDEFAWITDAAAENDDTKPEGFDCYSDPPSPFPTEAVAGGTPEAPLDDTADFVGAFRDADDNWMTGAWVDWSAGD